MRIAFFGMPGEFSCVALAVLLDAGIDVRAVFAPAARSVDPSPASGVVQLAGQRGIPIFEVARLDHPDALARFASALPDLACVACFPRRIPAAMLALSRFGFLNLHPSRLPAYRGPAPLFWQFRNGETSIGVTLHFMDEGLDTGDIVRQASIELPDGVSGIEAARLCAEAGGRLMAEAIRSLAIGGLARRRQPGGGSYDPAPAPDDFALDPNWPARRAFNFMRGTAEWGCLYRIDVGDERLLLTSALSYSAGQTLDQRGIVLGDEAWLQFAPGVLRARIGRS